MCLVAWVWQLEAKMEDLTQRVLSGFIQPLTWTRLILLVMRMLS